MGVYTTYFAKYSACRDFNDYSTSRDAGKAILGAYFGVEGQKKQDMLATLVQVLLMVTPTCLQKKLKAKLIETFFLGSKSKTLIRDVNISKIIFW